MCVSALSFLDGKICAVQESGDSADILFPPFTMGGYRQQL